MIDLRRCLRKAIGGIFSNSGIGLCFGQGGFFLTYDIRMVCLDINFAMDYTWVFGAILT